MIAVTERLGRHVTDLDLEFADRLAEPGPPDAAEVREDEIERVRAPDQDVAGRQVNLALLDDVFPEHQGVHGLADDLGGTLWAQPAVRSLPLDQVCERA